MEELNAILTTFAASGYALIAGPAQRFLDGQSNRKELRQALCQAQNECGSCGCSLDALYPKALGLLGTAHS